MPKRKLLLADDSITIQKVVNLTFADEGIEVVAVGDGDAAMLKFNESMPDLVLADVNMPGLDGYRICEMIKQDDETKHIPVILLVGSFEPFDEQEAWRVGADDFLTKPFQSIRQLVTKVSDLLNTPAEAKDFAEETLITDNYELRNDWQNADTKELPVQDLPLVSLGDTGMDDEMIQTSQVNEPVDDVQKFISDSYSYQENEDRELTDRESLTEESFTNEADEDFALLEPNTDNLTDENEDINAEAASEIPENKVYDFDDYQPAEDSPTTGETKFVETSEAEQPVEAAADEPENISADEKTVNTETVSDWQMVETTSGNQQFSPADYFEETQKTGISGEAESQNNFEDEETPKDQTNTNEAEINQSEPERSSFPVKETVSFDDLDLLELPPLVEETGIRPQIKNQEIHTVAESVTETAAPKPETAGNIETSADSMEISAHSFPPELIEAIAQKVAERISDKTIREIAWEVVPQMTDLIVKRLAEEQLNKKVKEMSE